jgi:hypothetical protein
LKRKIYVIMKTKLYVSMAAVISFVLCATGFAAGSKTFEVTGTILEVTPTLIAVQKDGERWEIDLDPQTKVSGELKVGAKVTIKYTMSAAKIDSSALGQLKGAAQDAAAAITSSVAPGSQKKEQPSVSPSASPKD